MIFYKEIQVLNYLKTATISDYILDFLLRAGLDVKDVSGQCYGETSIVNYGIK